MIRKRYIYQIYNKITEKSYIGSTVTIDKRKWEHFSKLRHKKHHSILLQRSFDKHGEDTFEFKLIEEFEGENRDQWTREQYWMDYFKCYDARYGYNISSDSSSRGRSLSLEERIAMGQKVSRRHKGKIPKNLELIRMLQKRQIIARKGNSIIELFESSREAAKYFGVDCRNIPYHIRKGEVKFGKMKGIILEYVDGNGVRKGKYHYGNQ